MLDLKTPVILNRDQESILMVYKLYTNRTEHTYLQYTAACALIYFLNKKNLFNYNLYAPMVYDYKEDRRYIWEDKVFMADINILRDEKYLIRARSKSKTYRDVNAHQCSSEGLDYINKKLNKSEDFKEHYEEIKKMLSCSEGHIYEVHLDEKGPKLVCEENAKEFVRFQKIEGFLIDLSSSDDETKSSNKKTSKLKHEPFFLST